MLIYTSFCVCSYIKNSVCVYIYIIYVCENVFYICFIYNIFMCVCVYVLHKVILWVYYTISIL